MRTTVGVRELKDKLSYYLRCVREGHEVVVTDHGRPVAILQPVSGNVIPLSEVEHLAALAAEGIVHLGTGIQVRAPRGKPGPSLSDAVLRDRSERG